MNILNLLLHIGAVVGEVKDTEQMVADLVAKRPAGQDAVNALKDLGALLGDEIFPLPAPLTVDIAEQVINQIVGVLGPMQAMVLKLEKI